MQFPLRALKNKVLQVKPVTPRLSLSASRKLHLPHLLQIQQKCSVADTEPAARQYGSKQTKPQTEVPLGTTEFM